MTNKSLRVLFWVFLVSFINDAYGFYSIYSRIDNFLFSNICLLIETLLLYYFFRLIILKQSIRKVIFGTALIFTGLWLFQIFRFGTVKYLNTCASIENFTILSLSIVYFYERFIKKNTVFLSLEPRFWLVVAYFIYSCGTFFLFLYLASLNLKEQENYYTLNYAFTIIRTILICTGLILLISKTFHTNTKLQKEGYR